MYFIDVQGTLIDDLERKPIDGAIELIDTLNSKRLPYMVITNNTKHSSSDFLNYLNSVGLNIEAKSYLDPLMLLESQVDKSSVAAYGSEPFLDVLVSMGYKLNYTNPKTLLISIRNDYSGEDYAQMIEFLLKGAKLIGMHETTLYSKNSKRYPGVGAILKMLSFATSANYVVVGKPSRLFYERALIEIKKENESLTFEDITIISDDVKGDLTGAKELGMRTTFVLSGKFRSAEEILPLLKKSEQPDSVFNTVKGVIKQL